MSKSIEGIVTWLKNWFYDESEIDGFVTTLTNSINGKLNKNLTEANKNLVTDGSGNVVLENKPVIPDVSGFIDTAGTGLSKSGTTLNHSNSITAQTSAVAKKIKYDGQGHITGTSTLYGSDIAVSSTDSTKINTALSNKANSTHTHEATEVADVNFNLYSHINPSNARQSDINSAIDTAIGSLSSIRAIEVVSTLPTASASTMGKLYIISENSKINVYYTVTDGNSYEWHKMDADILDELVVNWSDVQGKPTFSTVATSGSYNDLSNKPTIPDVSGFIDTAGAGLSKSGTTISHNWNVSPQTTPVFKKFSYNNQGHITGTANVTDLDLPHHTHNEEELTDSNAHSNLGTSAYAKQGAINTAIDTKIGTLQGGIITSIALVDKATDSSGKIIFYTGDEPT